MNIKRYISVATFTLLAAVSAACTDKSAAPPNASAPIGSAAENDPRAKVLGVGPGEPVKETAGTTSSAKSDVSKAQESNAMPLPGQANDHSTLSPKATQKPATTSTGAPPKP